MSVSMTDKTACVVRKLWARVLRE